MATQPTLNVGFTAGATTLQANRGLFSLEAVGQPLIYTPSGAPTIKFNPGWYYASDNHNGDSSSTGSGQNAGEVSALALSGTGGTQWGGSSFIGYAPNFTWGYLEPTLGSNNFQAIAYQLNSLQQSCPGARMILQLQRGYSTGSGANLSNGSAPGIPADMLTNSAYGAGPNGVSNYGWMFSGWNGVSGAGARWQIADAAIFRPIVYGRWASFLSNVAGYSFVTNYGPYAGQTFTVDTHPLIEAAWDWMEDSWNIWDGPATQADYSDSAMQTALQNGITSGAAAFPHTQYATFQSFGWANDGAYPNSPSLRALIGYAASNRNSLSNSDLFGNGLISAQQMYIGMNWNGSSWVTGATDYRPTMAYHANVQGYDYNNETPGSTVPQTMADIYTGMQTVHATHGIWNSTDEISFSGAYAPFMSNYLKPFVDAHSIPNTTRPTNLS